MTSFEIKILWLAIVGFLFLWKFVLLPMIYLMGNINWEAML